MRDASALDAARGIVTAVACGAVLWALAMGTIIMLVMLWN